LAKRDCTKGVSTKSLDTEGVGKSHWRFRGPRRKKADKKTYSDPGPGRAQSGGNSQEDSGKENTGVQKLDQRGLKQRKKSWVAYKTKREVFVFLLIAVKTDLQKKG